MENTFEKSKIFTPKGDISYADNGIVSKQIL